ncbi:MAG: CHAT domain-containing protein, partial [Bacteroidetes bacterium]|nr:CHAT domain-containing protein [Bacteroidota bacterium]MBU1717730.1 CHAT domain-containing protein [Bacteroidota bacterium]
MKKIVLHILLIFNFSFFIFHSSLYSQTWQEYDSLRTVFLEKGSYDSSIVFAEKALEVVKQKVGENDTLYANMLTALLEGNFYSGNFPKAIEYGEKEKKIRKAVQGEKHPDYATALNNLAYLNKEMGNFSAAEPSYLEAMNIYKEVLSEKSTEYAGCINNLASLYYNMGNFAAAEPLFIEAKSIYKEVLGEKDPHYATSVNNLAALYDDMDNFPEAELLYIEAMNIRKDVLGEKHHYYAQSLNNLAYFYTAMGKHAAAEALLLEATSIDKEVMGEKHPFYAIDLNNLAALYFAMENYNAAEPLFLEAKNIREEILGNKHPDYANSLANMATLYQAKRNFSAAEPLFLEGIEIVNGAINQNFAFLSEKEKEMYFETLESDFACFYAFSLKRKPDNQEITKTVFNCVVKNKGMLLKSSTAMRIAILNSKNPVLIANYSNWIALKKEIAMLYSTEISKREKNPEELEQQVNTLEKDLVRGSHIFGDYEKLQNLTWESVRSSLKPGEAAIEYVRFAARTDTVIYCALVIRSDSKYPEMIKLCEEKELSALLKKTSESDVTNMSNIYGTNQKTNQKLYKLIWQPIEMYLEGITNIYYSPDGMLHKVSFAAIGTGKNTYLCDSYLMKQQSSTGKVTMPEIFSLSGETTAGLFGGIKYSADTSSVKRWEYLPGTKSETDNIAQVFKKKKVKALYFTGADAKEDEFKTVAANCDILHLSTHGFFFPNPNTERDATTETEGNDEYTTRSSWGTARGYGVWSFVKSKNPLMRSGLAMAFANNVWSQRFPGEGEDGVLTASEVAQLDLHKTQLVVLSACETGLGDIKGSE